jgi:glycosyltransferase involved in cell wall biosynthesis
MDSVDKKSAGGGPASGGKILLVITKSNWGGAQRYVYDLATGLPNTFQISVAFGTEGLLAKKLRDANIKTFYIEALQRDVSILNDVKSFFELLKLFRAEKPDIVHLNSSKAGVVGALAARCAHIKKIIFTAHGWAFYENRSLWWKVPVALSQYLTVLLSDKTICVSKKVATDAHWMFGVQNRFRTIHNGVRSIELLSREEARAKIAPRVNASFWIGTIAELHPRKQLETAIAAFGIIADRYPQTILVIIGEGQEREKYERHIRTLGLTERVLLCGHIDNASSYLSAFDIFFSSSMAEGFAYAILEAGSAGLPIVATPVGGTPEIIIHGTTGLLVPPGNSATFANAFEQLLRDESLREKLGIAVRTRTDNEFSIEQMIQKTTELYRSYPPRYSFSFESRTAPRP